MRTVAVPAWAFRGRSRGGLARAGLAAAFAVCAVLPLSAVAQAWARPWPLEAAAKPATPAPAAAVSAPRKARRADFGGLQVAADVKLVADWALDTADSRGSPYLIIDKTNATVFVFDAAGRLQGSGPALLGMTRGDRMPDAVADQKVASIPVEDRLTPAGRFVASLDKDLHGKSILWIDYASSLALHRVVKGTPVERRAERLASATAQDNRISYGCINVAASFFDGIVGRAFLGTTGIVYILPEAGDASKLFGAYDVGFRPSPGVTSSGK